MPATSRLRASVAGSLPQDDSSGARQSPADALDGLSGSFENSLIALAFFDRRIRCQAFNPAFAAMCSCNAEEILGQTIQHSFAVHAKPLKAVLKRTFSEGSIVSNFELVSCEPSGPVIRWLVNLYPVKDARNRVRLVAVTFSPSSDENPPEFHLSHLVAKLYEALPPASSHLLASFPDVLAQSLQSASRSIRLLRDSMHPRSLLAGMQIEASLLPLALFLSLAESRPFTFVPPQLPATACAPLSNASLPHDVAPLVMDQPSPRELQVLRHLAAGQSNKEIGLALGISTRTVETYRARITRKLSLHSTAELVRYAIRHRIIDL